MRRLPEDPMFRTLLFTVTIVTANASVAFAQTNDTTTHGHRGTSVLFEAAVGGRLIFRRLAVESMGHSI